MNKPFKPEPIVPILAEVGVSISDLKRNPAAVVAAAAERQVAVLNRHKAVAYMVSPKVWEAMLDLVEDLEDRNSAAARLADLDQAIPVKLADLV